MKVTDLPFTAPRTDTDDVRCNFWSVNPSGNFEADRRTGEDYAKLALLCIAEENFPGLLGLVIHSMPTLLRDQTGIECGFLDYVGVAAANGVDGADYWTRHRRQEADERHQRERDKRSERARSAWARRRNQTVPAVAAE